jgi:imidazolonepropionase-like amidohydrolase
MLKRLALVALALISGPRAADGAAGRPKSSTAAERPLALVGATVVRPDLADGEAAQTNATVVISGSRIVSVAPAERATIPEGARIVDVKGKWIVPGLVDGHIHFFQSGNLYTRPDIADLTGDVPYRQEDARNRARLPATLRYYLASGVTGVVDVGGPFWNFKLRDATARRARGAAPRVLVAGPLLATVARPQLDLGDPPIVKVDSPAAVRALVRRQLERKPDFIKFWFIHRPGDDLAAQEALVRTAGELAHGAGVRFAVHATQLEVAKAALRAGADALVHSVEDRPVDAELLRLARRNRVIYIPTLFVVDGYRLALAKQWRPSSHDLRLADPEVVKVLADRARVPDPARSPSVARALARFSAGHAVAAKNLRKVWDAGVTVVMGTDAGNIGTPHGPSVFRELALMVKAGLTPRQALLSATLNAARLLGLERELGLVGPGRVADLVVLDADPLADIANAARVHLVVKGGRALRPAEILADTPAELVQRQLNAYNARDLEAFLATYADDVVIVDGETGAERMRGKQALRARYGALFAASPDLHATIARRTVRGNVVTDHERVRGHRGSPAEKRAVARYELAAGLIRKVTFLPDRSQ